MTDKTFDNGVPVDAVADTLLQTCTANGAPFSEPYVISSQPSFYDWLKQPIAASPRRPPMVTNYLLSFHGTQPDLVKAFPDPANANFQDYLSWLGKHGETRGIIPEFLEDALPLSPGRGVNVVGFHGSSHSIGITCRGYACALERAGEPVFRVNLTECMDFRQPKDTWTKPAQLGSYPINLICVNAEGLPHLVNLTGDDLLSAKYNIGVWWWELSDFPPRWFANLRHLQEIWVGSNFVQEAIAKISDLPVVRVPPVVEMPVLKGNGRYDFGFDGDAFVFLFTFDFGSVFERKNPLAVIESFKRAFPQGEPSRARLVIKAVNGEHYAKDSQNLKVAVAGDDRIKIMDMNLPSEENLAMINSCDCYVSLHRSEGFGLTLAEAMCFEKPVITTAWSGNMDFCTPGNSFLIDFELIKSRQIHKPYPRGCTWADPSTEHAAKMMKYVMENPQEAQERGRKGKVTILRDFSEDAVAKIAGQRLTRLSDDRFRGRKLTELEYAEMSRPKNEGASVADEALLEAPTGSRVGGWLKKVLGV